MNDYSHRGLLVIDEIGYLAYDARAAALLFQVVSRRYKRKSVVMTTNLPFSEWPTIFPNAWRTNSPSPGTAHVAASGQILIARDGRPCSAQASALFPPIPGIPRPATRP